MYWEDCLKAADVQQITPLEIQRVQKHQTSEDTLYSENTLHSECPFTSTTAENSEVAPTLSRVNSHTCTFKALLHSTMPVQSTKYGSVDRNSTGLFLDTTWYQAHRAPDPVVDANVYVRSLNKLDPSIATDTDCCAAANIRACSMSVDITTSDCSS